MFTCARRADMSFKDVTIKILDRGCDQGCEWRHAPEAWAEIFEKKAVSWVLPREKTVDFRLLAEPLCRVRMWFGADGKIRCISLLMSKNLLTQR